MLEKFLHILTGYLKIEIRGTDKSRIINIAIKNDINFWDYQKSNESYIVSIRIRDYRKLIEFKDKYQVSVKILKKIGLPFQINKFKKRYGLILGLIVGSAIYFYFSCCYWSIDINGVGIYSKEEILQTAKECGLYEGAFKWDINERNVANKMTLKLPEINWISVNTNGSCAMIELIYSKEKPEIMNDDEPCNLVAEKMGVVVSIKAQEGIPLVQVGETVSIGQVLITGEWDTNLSKNEWSQEENPAIFQKQARGEVLAQTQRKYVVTIPKIQNDYQKQNCYERYKIAFFGIEIPLTLSLVPNGNYSYQVDKEDIYLLDVKLPIQIQTEKLISYDKFIYELNDESARLKIEQILGEKMEKDSTCRILEKGEIIVTSDDGNYYGELNCVCIEDIVKIEKFAVK